MRVAKEKEITTEIKTTKALSTIIRYWRLRLKYNTTQILVRNFVKARLSPEDIARMSFNTISVLCKKGKNIETTRRLLQRIMILILGSQHTVAYTQAAKFLRAAMMCKEPHCFKSVDGISGANLLLESQLVLDSFYKIISHLEEHGTMHGVDKGLKDSFLPRLNAYLYTYSQWKPPDKEDLANGVIQGLWKMYKWRHQTPKQKVNVLAEIHHQIIRLRAKFFEIGVPRDQIEQLDAEVSKMKPIWKLEAAQYKAKFTIWWYWDLRFRHNTLISLVDKAVRLGITGEGVAKMR